jgi:uncharacterized Fe-S cluster protein YjdI
MAATIEIRPNGPLAVSGLEKLYDADGREIVHAELTVKLCRCGGSMNKPFCDGTHKRNGFSGERIADGSKDKLKSYVGPGITIHDNRSVCVHAGRCTDGLPTVFKYEREPWIDPAGAPPQQVVETIRHCPSGALTYTVEGQGTPPGAVAPLDHGAQGRPLRGAGRGAARCRVRQGRAARALHALPLRRLEEQAVLRRDAFRHRLQGLTCNGLCQRGPRDRAEPIIGSP